ncbi:MAG: ROK family protein [Thermoplasmatota archaeon]
MRRLEEGAAAPVSLRDDPSAAFVGVDLGGTKIECALVESDGRVELRDRRPTPVGLGPEAVLEEVALGIEGLVAQSSFKLGGVGVGIAGQVDADNGIVHTSPNLRWRDVPAGRILTKRVDAPVTVANDVFAATIGEWTCGIGRGERDLACVFIGTGIGGGVVSHGHPLRGADGTAAEFGHMALVEGGRKCHCSATGCWEAYVGGWAIAERAREAVKASPLLGSMILKVAGSHDAIDARAVEGAAARQDPLALLLEADFARSLGRGLASVVNAFNPRLLVLGGGVVESWPRLVRLAEKELYAQALEVATAKLRVAKAGLGNDAGVVGAAHLARTARGPGGSDQ